MFYLFLFIPVKKRNRKFRGEKFKKKAIALFRKIDNSLTTKTENSICKLCFSCPFLFYFENKKGNQVLIPPSSSLYWSPFFAFAWRFGVPDLYIFFFFRENTAILSFLRAWERMHWVSGKVVQLNSLFPLFFCFLSLNCH